MIRHYSQPLWAFSAILTLILPALPARAQSRPEVVISQVYGAGGNSGAAYRNDFVELFNRGAATVDLKGWAIHYSSAAGTSWQKTELSGTIAPGRRLLVQQASGGAAGSPLPAADVTGSIAMASTAGKVVLTSTAASIPSGTACPSGAAVVDLVGYGAAANCFEGAGPAPAPGATTAVVRARDGCQDTNQNAADFAAAAIAPRNLASPASPCPQTATDPGTAYPAGAEAGDQRPGSVLVYPLYSSRSASPSSVNARLAVTNTDRTRPVTLRFIFVDARPGRPAEGFISLTPGQTSAFLASDSDPDVTGYVIAVCVDSLTGLPVSFNAVIGEVSVKLASGHAAILPAESYGTGPGWPAGFDRNASTVELKFDGLMYDRFASELAAAGLDAGSRADSAMLFLNRIGGSPGAGLPVEAETTVVLQYASGSLSLPIRSSQNQFSAALHAELLKTARSAEAAPPPEGSPVWARIRQNPGRGLTGAIINYHPGSRIDPAAFNQGRNLHRLSLADSVTLALQVVPPDLR